MYSRLKPPASSRGIYISQFDLLDVVLAFNSKNLQITSKLLTQGYSYHKLRKTFGKFLRSYAKLLSKLLQYRFKNMYLKNHSSGLLRWSCPQTKEGQRRIEFHLVGLDNSETPSTSSVWLRDHREDYRSSAWPFTALYRSLCPPLKKEGHIALHLSVGMSVFMSVALNLVQLITQ